MIEARAQFVTVLDIAASSRVLNAEPVERLSDRDDKFVEVVRDINDTRFVRRSYSADAVGAFERRSLSFSEGLNELRHIFEGAGIELVSHRLFQFSPSDSEYPVVVATEFLEDDIDAASLEAKVKAARALGTIPGVHSDYHPGLEIFSRDMFRVKRDETGERLVLVDIDPFLDDKFFTNISESALDTRNYGFIMKTASALWNSCQLAERRPVIGAFLRSLVSNPGFDITGNSRISEALMVTQAMTQGMDMRGQLS